MTWMHDVNLSYNLFIVRACGRNSKRMMPLMSRNVTSVILIFDSDILVFFCLVDSGHLVSELYSENHNSFPAWLFQAICFDFETLKDVLQIGILHFWLSDNTWCHLCIRLLRIFRRSVTTCCAVSLWMSLLMKISPAIVRAVRQRSAHMICLTRSMLFFVLLVDDLSHLESSSNSSSFFCNFTNTKCLLCKRFALFKYEYIWAWHGGFSVDLLQYY